MKANEISVAMIKTCSFLTHSLNFNFLKASIKHSNSISTKKSLKFCMLTKRSMRLNVRADAVRARLMAAGENTRNSIPKKNPANMKTR